MGHGRVSTEKPAAPGRGASNPITTFGPILQPLPMVAESSMSTFPAKVDSSGTGGPDEGARDCGVRSRIMSSCGPTAERKVATSVILTQ